MIYIYNHCLHKIAEILSTYTRFRHNVKHLTSSKCRKIFDPNHQVNLGEGYPPTAWQVTSISLSADRWLILSKIETPVGFTEKQTHQLI